MRLVIDGRRLGEGRTGVGRYLETLLAEWAGSGPPLPHTVVVLQDPRGRAVVPRGEGWDAVVVGETWPGLFWEIGGLGRYLRPDDLLFAPTNLIPPTWRGRTVLVVFDTLQDRLPESFPWHVRWRFGPRYRLAARRADRILVPSHATARDVQRLVGIPASRLCVIPPAPAPGFRPQPADAPALDRARNAVGVGPAPFFLFVGKRSKRRNVAAILDAFRLHLRSHPDHRLVFVGPDAPDSATLEREPGVVVAGHVEEEILHGLMPGAVALLYPSEYEGFGLPVLEALASGCPVIALANSALPEAGGAAAWYLESAQPELMAETMRRVWNDRDERERRIALGLNHAATLNQARFAEAVKHELVAAAAVEVERSRTDAARSGSRRAQGR